MPNKAAEQVNIVLESDAANSPTSLSEEELALLRTEEEILERTLASLQTQLESRGELLKAEDFRSRELTAELVAATRDEDKQMLASDEAVSHALKQNHSGEAKSLTRLLEKPYFARFVVEEEDRGRTKTVEYKIGHASNPDCRIIDWRKSPLAKLYYEYQEGEEFCEEIQGTEREGTIVLRHPVRIEDGILKSVTTRFGTFSLVNGDWTRSSMRASGKGGIRSVLPLITPDQFRTITEDAKTAVLIQGIAGSGKTTVALHRLAWLLHENNSEFGAEDCAVIVRNEVLGEFIKHTLDAIDIEGVSVFTFAEWREKVCRLLAPEIRIGRFNRAGLVESSLPPKGLTIFLHSEQYFEFFEAAIKEPQSDTSVSTFWNITKNVMTSAASGGGTYSALGLDLSAISRYLDTCAEQSYVPDELVSSFLRFLLHSESQSSVDPSPPTRFKHLVVDELQDYSLVALSCLMNGVKETRDLTLVGDIGQALSEEHDFVGWERLREVWDIELGEHAKFFTLEVSHRSTLPIMRLASRVAERALPDQGRQGRVPIWFHCEGEQSALGSALTWLEKALERFPDCLSAVLCRDHEEASQLHSLLKPTFGPQLRYGKGAQFTFEEGLIVTTVDDVKGLEFTNALLWNPSQRSYPKGDRVARNRMYVAMTRAEENLCIVTWGRYSGLLPSTHSKLVRGYDFRDNLEDARSDS